jgi:hypothetical protein
MRQWVTWEEPERDVTVAYWVDRDLAVVFPRRWADRHGLGAMIVRAQDRIRMLEGATGKTLVPGSVLLAFSRHGPRSSDQSLTPDVPQGLARVG